MQPQRTMREAPYSIRSARSGPKINLKNTEKKGDIIMKDQNCIFCKIANGEIPSAEIYCDDNFRVILDLSPASKGHALILPKEHAADLIELPDETASKAIVLAKKIGMAMKEALGCDGFNLVQNNGAAAGQTVRHFHLHVIPRYEGDGPMVVWEPHESDPNEQAALAEKLRNALA